MRTLATLLSVGVLLFAGCRSARRASAPALVPSRAAAPAAVPDASGPQRLRYYDMKDFPIRNGILIVRGTQPQLKAIDGHLSGMRRILGEVKKRESEQAFTPVRPKGPKLVVQIHAVADIVAARPDLDVLAAIRKGLGAERMRDVMLRMQGTSAVIVKAPLATHDPIAEILDQLRGELKANR